MTYHKLHILQQTGIICDECFKAECDRGICNEERSFRNDLSFKNCNPVPFNF